MNSNSGNRRIQRWECHCGDRPILLGTLGDRGNVYLSIRKRHYHVVGAVDATCLRCGAVHQHPELADPTRPAGKCG